MRFLHPAFLFALFAVLIPVLIHLFSFRRFKTVYFSNVSYLKNIRKESQKKSRIKQLLILLCRIAAITMLVFAFAQPYKPGNNRTIQLTNPVVAIYIDNSFSMNALSSQGQLLEAARNKALEIAGSYPPGTRFMLITNDMLPQHRHIFNKEQLIQQISEFKATPRSVPLSLIHDRIINNLTESGEKRSITAFYLSDFQKNSSDLRNFTSDSSQVNYFLPFSPGNIKNLYIDSCWMELPAHKLGQEEKLKVRIVNNSEEAYRNLPLKFYLNDTLKALGNFNIEPGGEQVVGLKYINMSSGLHLGHAEISDYPLTYDNTYYLSYRVQSHLQALAIYDGVYGKGNGLPYLRALFDGDDYVSLGETAISNLQLSKLNECNTIFILNTRNLSTGLVNELKKAAGNGATVVFFPETDGNLNDYNNLLGIMPANRITGLDTARQQIAGIDWEHPIYAQAFRKQSENVSFPFINGHFVFSEETRIPEIRLMWLRDNARALTSQTVGNGHLVVFSFPLSERNREFARDILFVPTIYSLVINSLPQQKISCTIGEESFYTIPRNAVPEVAMVNIVNKATGEEYKPELSVTEGNLYKIGFSGFFEQAGQYLVNSEGKAVAAISMNYNRKESQNSFYTSSDLRAEIEKNNIDQTYVIENQDKSFNEIFDEIQQGKKMWRNFLLFALIFVLAEAMIIRLWK